MALHLWPFLSAKYLHIVPVYFVGVGLAKTAGAGKKKVIFIIYYLINDFGFMNIEQILLPEFFKALNAER